MQGFWSVRVLEWNLSGKGLSAVHGGGSGRAWRGLACDPVGEGWGHGRGGVSDCGGSGHDGLFWGGGGESGVGEAPGGRPAPGGDAGGLRREAGGGPPKGAKWGDSGWRSVWMPA